MVSFIALAHLCPDGRYRMAAGPQNRPLNLTREGSVPRIVDFFPKLSLDDTQALVKPSGWAKGVLGRLVGGLGWRGWCILGIERAQCGLSPGMSISGCSVGLVCSVQRGRQECLSYGLQVCRSSSQTEHLFTEGLTQVCASVRCCWQQGGSWA